MPEKEYLGSPSPKLVLYLPHRPNGLEQLAKAPDSGELIRCNSNHWRKIVTLLAKVASPEEEWRAFRDDALFQHTALCFAPHLMNVSAWHWIGGKENLERFDIDGLNPVPLQEAPVVAIDAERQILLTPYPDYRQLNNATVGQIRAALNRRGFYSAN
ncbi:DUF6942 family protein [Microbulbifer sp. SA54]|uniref:DUF6942 family protein n=1 Tax=Microbulbifer sp. SA54 TaxID=3401577 RepID=UPI003AB056C9